MPVQNFFLSLQRKNAPVSCVCVCVRTCKEGGWGGVGGAHAHVETSG